jgi:hypothetical protein
MVDTLKTDKNFADEEIDNKSDAPKTFGELVTSDSMFAIKRNSTSTARHGDTTSLVVRDKGTGWIASYPSKRKSADDIQVAVNDFKGSETIKR